MAAPAHQPEGSNGSLSPASRADLESRCGCTKPAALSQRAAGSTERAPCANPSSAHPGTPEAWASSLPGPRLPSMPLGCRRPTWTLHRDQVAAIWGLCAGKRAPAPQRDYHWPEAPEASPAHLCWCLCASLGPRWFKSKQQQPHMGLTPSLLAEPSHARGSPTSQGHTSFGPSSPHRGGSRKRAGCA